MAERSDLEAISPRQRYDAVNMLLGRKLGAGTTRRVYVNDLNPLQVVKLDMSTDFANVMEWNLWHEFKDTELAHWLAPCDHISPSGEFLVQRRTEQPLVYPKWIPSALCDLKLTNFGVLVGTEQLVCHDYGMLHLNQVFSGSRLRFKRADWWRLDPT